MEEEVDVNRFFKFILLVEATRVLFRVSSQMLTTDTILETSFLISLFNSSESSTIACVISAMQALFVVTCKLPSFAFRYNIERSFTPSMRGTVVI